MPQWHWVGMSAASPRVVAAAAAAVVVEVVVGTSAVVEPFVMVH